MKEIIIAGSIIAVAGVGLYLYAKNRNTVDNVANALKTEGGAKAIQQLSNNPMLIQSDAFLLTGKPIERSTLNDILYTPKISAYRSIGSGDVNVKVDQSVLPITSNPQNFLTGVLNSYTQDSVQSNGGLWTNVKKTVQNTQHSITENKFLNPIGSLWESMTDKLSALDEGGNGVIPASNV